MAVGVAAVARVDNGGRLEGGGASGGRGGGDVSHHVSTSASGITLCKDVSVITFLVASAT